MYTIKLDGNPVFTGAEYQILDWFHAHTPYSADLAIKAGGYSVEPATIPDLENKIKAVEQEWKDWHKKMGGVTGYSYPTHQVKEIRDEITKLKNTRI